jgi:hypothetical protein
VGCPAPTGKTAEERTIERTKGSRASLDAEDDRTEAGQRRWVGDGNRDRAKLAWDITDEVGPGIREHGDGRQGRRAGGVPIAGIATPDLEVHAGNDRHVDARTMIRHRRRVEDRAGDGLEATRIQKAPPDRLMLSGRGLDRDVAVSAETEDASHVKANDGIREQREDRDRLCQGFLLFPTGYETTTECPTADLLPP